MAVPYLRFFDQMQSIVDSINHDSDNAVRLANLQRLQQDMRKILLDSRDSAAYDLRAEYSSEDAEQLAGVSRRYIDYWAKRWIKRTGSAPLKNRRRIDLSGSVDLSGNKCFPSTRSR